ALHRQNFATSFSGSAVLQQEYDRPARSREKQCDLLPMVLSSLKSSKKPRNKMNKTWFITGATRGIGAAIAKAALDAGNKVVATGRKLEAVNQALGTAENLRPLALVVTRDAQLEIR